MITDELEDAKRRAASGDLRWAAVPSVLVSAAVGGGLAFAAISLLERVHRARCSADTFLAGDPVLMGAPVLFLAFAGAAGMIVLVEVSTAAMGGSGWWDRRAALAREPSSKGVRTGAAWMAGVCAALFVLTLPFGLLFQTCLSPAGIDTQMTLWSGLRHHPWSEVTLVETECRYGKGGWTDDLILHIADGQRFSLASMTTRGAWSAGYPGVQRALHGRPFLFDPSSVSPRCRSPDLALLLERP